MDYRVHILGASGSGTTTLGSALGRRLDIKHLDSDDFFWESTEIKFSKTRPAQERLEMIEEQITDLNSWVLSGSLCSWGNPLISRFTHVIFLQTPWGIRERRLNAREKSRYGDDIFCLSTPQSCICREFLEWAGRYDNAGLEQRSLKTHADWLISLPERIHLINLDGSEPIDWLLEQCIGSIR